MVNLCVAGYLSDEDELSRRRKPADMSVFRDAVQDCLDYDHKSALKTAKLKQNSSSNESEVEKYSGLRIRLAYIEQVYIFNSCQSEIAASFRLGLVCSLEYV